MYWHHKAGPTSVVGTQQRRRVPGAIIIRVSHHFDAKLVVAHLAEDVAVAGRDKVVKLVDSPITGQR